MQRTKGARTDGKKKVEAQRGGALALRELGQGGRKKENWRTSYDLGRIRRRVLGGRNITRRQREDQKL